MTEPPASSPSRQKRFTRNDLLVVLLGVACLLVSHHFVYRGPTLSDEFAYAVVARNVAEQGSLDTTLYRVDSVLRRGYPSRDVHVPGYILALAASLSVFGVNDFALGLPGQLAYLLAGLVFFRICISMAAPLIAVLATFLFYIYPINFAYANLIMVEAPFALLALICVALWIKIWRAGPNPGLLAVGLLASVIVVGMLFRQTFLVFLPPAFIVLLSGALRYRRVGPLVLFCVVFVVLSAGLYWPLARERAYYPSAFDQAFEATDWGTAFAIMGTNAINNFLKFVIVLPFQVAMAAVHLILAVVAIAAFRAFDSSRRVFVYLCLYLFWAPLLALPVLYAPLLDVTMLRNSAAFVLPTLFLFVLVVSQIRSPRLRYGSMLSFIVLMGLSSVFLVGNVMKWQRDSVLFQQYRSGLISRYLTPYSPRAVISSMTFGYAWEQYPTVIVWDPPQTVEQLRALTERLPVDAIVAQTDEERDRIVKAVSTGIVKTPYRLLFPHKVENHYFFVDERLLLDQKK